MQPFLIDVRTNRRKEYGSVLVRKIEKHSKVFQNSPGFKVYSRALDSLKDTPDTKKTQLVSDLFCQKDTISLFHQKDTISVRFISPDKHNKSISPERHNY